MKDLIATVLKETSYAIVFLVIAVALIYLCSGCATAPVKTFDTRALTGKILQDGRTGKLLIPDHVEGNKYYIHELSPNGEILFFKDAEE